MKCLSLFALCTSLVLITGCGKNTSSNTCCTTETTTTKTSEENSSVEAHNELAAAEAEKAAGNAKENLAETDLEKTMHNK